MWADWIEAVLESRWFPGPSTQGPVTTATGDIVGARGEKWSL